MRGRTRLADRILSSEGPAADRRVRTEISTRRRSLLHGSLLLIERHAFRSHRLTTREELVVTGLRKPARIHLPIGELQAAPLRRYGQPASNQSGSADLFRADR